MNVKRILGLLLKMVACVVGLYVLLVLFILWQESFEKYGIEPDSFWVMAVSREVRQMPTPEGAVIQSYAVKGNDHRGMGFDLVIYAWKHNPNDFNVWLSYWKHLGYGQVANRPANSWTHCEGFYALLNKKDITYIEICHDPKTMTTSIEKRS